MTTLELLGMFGAALAVILNAIHNTRQVILAELRFSSILNYQSTDQRVHALIMSIAQSSSDMVLVSMDDMRALSLTMGYPEGTSKLRLFGKTIEGSPA